MNHPTARDKVEITRREIYVGQVLRRHRFQHLGVGDDTCEAFVSFSGTPNVYVAVFVVVARRKLAVGFEQGLSAFGVGPNEGRESQLAFYRRSRDSRGCICGQVANIQLLRFTAVVGWSCFEKDLLRAGVIRRCRLRAAAVRPSRMNVTCRVRSVRTQTDQVPRAAFAFVGIKIQGVVGIGGYEGRGSGDIRMGGRNIRKCFAMGSKRTQILHGSAASVDQSVVRIVTKGEADRREEATSVGIDVCGDVAGRPAAEQPVDRRQHRF